MQPLRQRRYASATQCQSDITEFDMVPYGSFSILSGHVEQYCRESAIPLPIMVPNFRQPGYTDGYYETEFCCTPTSGIICWLGNEELRKKHEADETAAKKLIEQQRKLNEQLDVVNQQYKLLNQALAQALKAKKRDEKLIKKLTGQLEELASFVS